MRAITKTNSFIEFVMFFIAHNASMLILKQIFAGRLLHIISDRLYNEEKGKDER